MPTQRPTQSDRRRLDQLTELASTDSGTSDGGPEPIVSPATAAAIRARSPWFVGDPSERDLSAWSPPRAPESDASTEKRRRFPAVLTGYYDDLAAIYGEAWVQGLALVELRAAREHVRNEDRPPILDEDVPDGLPG